MVIQSSFETFSKEFSLAKNSWNVADGLLVNPNGLASRPGVRHSSEPRKRFPASGSSDEDPYSLTPSGMLIKRFHEFFHTFM